MDIAENLLLSIRQVGFIRHVCLSVMNFKTTIFIIVQHVYPYDAFMDIVHVECAAGLFL